MVEVSMFTEGDADRAPGERPDARPDAVQPRWSAEDWAAHRRAPRRTDHVLTDVTRTWMHRLPRRRRPLRLASRFPRVANRIALCWAEPTLAEQVLADLLEDRRGSRRGFPLLVARELQRLRDFRLA